MELGQLNSHLMKIESILYAICQDKFHVDHRSKCKNQTMQQVAPRACPSTETPKKSSRSCQNSGKQSKVCSNQKNFESRKRSSKDGRKLSSIFTWPSLTPLPTLVVVLKVVTHVLSVGPWSLVPEGVEQTYAQRTVFIYSNLSVGYLKD